jgi:hypothetical protein
MVIIYWFIYLMLFVIIYKISLNLFIFSIIIFATFHIYHNFFKKSDVL